MSIRPRLTVAPEHNATPSLAEEVRELRKLAKDRRVASLALFRDSTKHLASPVADVPRRRREPVAV
jgi:hypothetical protein